MDRERSREVGSRRSGLGPLCCCASWLNTGWLEAWVGVEGDVDSPEALLVLEKIFMLVDVELERKMPLKLRRWGDLGEAF